MIASARMYSWAPSLAAAWHRLLEWVAARASVPMTVMDASDPTSLDELWARPDLGCAFMCGYPWALVADKPRLLAAPIPSPARYGGRPAYVTDFIVKADGPHRTLADTFGGRIAYSTEHSHSGYNAPRFHLLRYRTPERATFYREVIGPFVRQRPCLDAVVDGRAEVAAIDGYGLDLLARHAPDVAARVRVVETTLPAPSPPLVASPGADAASCERLTAALAQAHEASEIRATLDDLLLSRFVRVAPEDFQVFLDREQAAEAAGYPKLA
jgi:ABC-type phosphate/phosphonate transport system substrate-binding protein